MPTAPLIVFAPPLLNTLEYPLFSCLFMPTALLAGCSAAVLLASAAVHCCKKRNSILPQQKSPLDTPSTSSKGNEHQIHDQHYQKLFCLIIGIDRYSHSSLKDLAGAVNDANDVSSLVSDLGVPDDHIVKLQNEEATRERIIQELQDLSSNPDIEFGDPILIYYAGHGGLREADTKWKDKHGTKQIQVIFPYDYGDTVNCIPDTTIADLLNKLAHKKGDNITVIFDSCHSASGTRADESDPEPMGRDQRYRDAEVLFEIPSDIDSHLISPDDARPTRLVKKERDANLLLYSDQGSHVHLAACRASQKAAEDGGHGVFTAELLEQIRQKGANKLTYRDLIKSLTIPKNFEQSPECYGKFKDRTLFNSRISNGPLYIDVEIPKTKGGSLTLKAGAASGVTLGSTWVVYQGTSGNLKPVGSSEVTYLSDSIATLKPLDSEESTLKAEGVRLYARCKRIGPLQDKHVLRVWIAPEVKELLFPGLGQFSGSSHESGISYKVVGERSDADIALEVHGHESIEERPMVSFHWRDEMSSKYRTEELPCRKPATREDVETVLFAAARWKWHLRRSNDKTKRTVTMDMLKVATKSGQDSNHREFIRPPQDVPVGDAGAVEIELGVGDSPIPLYGMRLRSSMPSPIYVRVFYFDTTNFSIEGMSECAVALGAIEPDIAQSRDHVLVGGGGESGSPICFSLSSSKPVELGYMKVFWSTHQLELDIEQKSVFEIRPGDLRGAHKEPNFFESDWGTTSLAMILREEGILA